MRIEKGRFEPAYGEEEEEVMEEEEAEVMEE